MSKTRILVMNGSTRENGNTDAILKSFMKGVTESGINVREAVLRDLTINNCIGCCKCKREKKCNFQDDMSELRDMVMKSDILVFASPIYWCEVTGLMKTFIDRLYFFHHEENKHLVSGKKALIITTLGEKEAEYESRVLIEFYRRFTRSLGIEILDFLSYGGLMEKDAITSRPEFLKAAEDAGKKLGGATSA
ncbi:MAG: flavodoxin family protein [candidate division WOR-3 bacterium]|nr:MAG: flavodoxin family protein [candidate division WOR-3 bacterium]